MAVIYNCIYCGKDIKSNCVYDGPALGFSKFIEEKTKELSDNCECRGKHMTVAEKLSQYRKNLNLSQRELAKRSGLTAPAINQYESGKRVPDLKSFRALCKTLEISMDRFMENVAI
jgi:DNA-binding XRE family transcriptional regulator